ncbi:MAG: bifunctional (p)ppGpp synthetase/guanosine-3',5'-bis(diphosphate) 3'-pyrophosphohydrolase [Candidatus Aminicenantes bacterium 4484_214]|nr:MAG: bifunctional (p)ppGpp synthetase/guanosine-3',5'-bis(diphosphate) 3'-pyrophosphohydrolase [Candidatus Aminicenantes bacterium 4484_214]RLE10982.1 MAG: bifunctional (p)ppGpp synthetase/guanosine-3',5'-bis(diphosphate) 3'-pyrophosphohydrolase [Candidatus Aminicenantes bacterium]
MIRFDDILDKLSYLPEKDLTLLKKAYVFAAQAHQGQTRRSGEPYLSHPLEVAAFLAEMKMDPTTISAGLLHDVLEDTPTTADELNQIFGSEVTHLVEGVTKISRLQEASPTTRHAESLRKIILAMTDDLRVIFIKLADRLHNLKTLKYLDEEKQQQIAQETLDIYAPLANRLGMGKIKAELEDFSFRYVDPESYFRIASIVDPIRKDAEKTLKKTKKTMASLMRENQIPAEIQHRIKRLYSIYNKMKKRGITFEEVYDFMALRLITDSFSNCYHALGIIHEHWPHIPHRFHDFIAMPKSNLYQSIHTTIIVGKKKTIEVQIRTKKMHEIAEHGIAAHWRYKEPTILPDAEQNLRLQWLREMVDLYQENKSPQYFLRSLKSNLIPEDITVLTPKGDTVSLPLGASALDFAFKIHTEIGLHAAEARINSRPVPLKTILKSGEIVEIITRPDIYPRREWLNMAFTHAARQHIRRWLNQQQRQQHIAWGKHLWQKVASQQGWPATPPEFFLQALAKLTNLKIKNEETLYSLLGRGKLTFSRKLIQRLAQLPPEEAKRASLIKRMVPRLSRRTLSEATLIKDKTTSFRLAKCCHPIKGEPIIGYLTVGEGITIHAQRCPLVVQERLNPERIVEISWPSSAGGPFPAQLEIATEDRPGLLAQITTVIAEQKANIKQAKASVFSDGQALISLLITVKDYPHLKKIQQEIKKIAAVLSVSQK